MGHLVSLFEEHAQAKVHRIWGQKPKPYLAECIEVPIADLLKFLSLPPIHPDRLQAILRSLAFETELQGNTLLVRPPSFRHDCRSWQDIAEELIRCLGFDAIIEKPLPLKLSGSAMLAFSKESGLTNHWQAGYKALQTFAALGFHEVVNFGFTSNAALAKFELPSTLQILNPLSLETQTLVPSLLPGLVQNLSENLTNRFGSEIHSIRLIEMRPVFEALPDWKQRSTPEKTGTQESLRLAGIVYGLTQETSLQSAQKCVNFYDIKGLLEAAWEQLTFGPLSLQPLSKAPHFLVGHQSASIAFRGKTAGIVGRLHPVLASEFRIKHPCFVFEISLEAFLPALQKPFHTAHSFKAWSPVPGMQRDFAFVADASLSCEKVTHLALKTAKPLAKQVRVFDRYYGPELGEGKVSIGIRVDFEAPAPDKPLTEEQITQVSAKLCDVLTRELKCSLRSF
jgi:phenylalanyl-tRNA synthetase beta chain